MRKTLFSKIFFTQIIVTILAMSMVIPLIFLMIGEYFVSSQKGDLLGEATRVADISARMAEAGDNQSIWAFYRYVIEHSNPNSVIIVTNADGDVIASPKNIPGIDLENINEKFISPVKTGEPVVRLYGNGTIFEEQMLVAMAPILQKDSKTGEMHFLGASAVIRPMPQIKQLQHKVTGIMFFAQLVIWILSFVVSMFVTRRITQPIKKMRIAAKSIAAGNFNERIAITSNDEIGQLAESFNFMTEALNELETMRSSFISDVSHELRTPMTIISGFIEGIVDGTIPESEHRKYLDIVLSETKRLSRLVSDLLEASRLEQGRVELNIENLDMNRTVTEAIITYEQRLTEKNIDVSLELDGEECIARADKDSIRRVLINLIDNAIKFTPENGKISIATAHRDKKVDVTVENTGQGITKEDLKHIWERFYKTDKSRSMDKRGVGLGLHIVKTIINQHGGEIRAESEEGKFARFIFTLDAKQN